MGLQDPRLERKLVILLVVLGVEAVEDPPTEGKDGPTPGQAVAPVELVVDPQVDALDELDGVEDQAAGLEDDWRTHSDSENEAKRQKKSRKSEFRQVSELKAIQNRLSLFLSFQRNKSENVEHCSKLLH